MSGASGTVPVALSSASVWPERVGAAFELAAELGYDGVEVMVWTDPASQDVPALVALSERYEIEILSLHAPCLLITQRVWTPDPAARLNRTVAAAATLGARSVVVHPPFRWQRRYAAGFLEQVTALEARSGLTVAVENMFPLRGGPVAMSGFAGPADPTEAGYPHYTLDLSHTAAARADALELAARMGPLLAHVHLADGSGAARDEHLVPGHGTQPCVELCRRLGAGGFSGTVVVEVSTRYARDRAERRAALSEALLFARLNV